MLGDGVLDSQGMQLKLLCDGSKLLARGGAVVQPHADVRLAEVTGDVLNREFFRYDLSLAVQPRPSHDQPTIRSGPDHDIHGSFTEASAARIRPAETRRATLKRGSDRKTPGSDPQPPPIARTLQAGGHRFDPGWLHSGNPLKQTAFGHSGSSTMCALTSPIEGSSANRRLDSE